MTQTIVGAISAVAAVVRSTGSIEAAPTYPTEQASEQLFAVTYLTRGDLNIGPVGTKKSLVNISIDLLKVRGTIEIDIATLLPYTDSIPAALLGEMSYSGDQFSGAIQTFEKLTTEFMPLYVYGSVQMIGYRFTMENCKLLVDLP